MCASMRGPLGETVNVVLAIGSIVDLFGSSTIKFFACDNFRIDGTSDKRSRVSVAPVSPIVGIMASGRGGGVEVMFRHVEMFLKEFTTCFKLKSMTPARQTWPPGTSPGLRALICA